MILTWVELFDGFYEYSQVIIYGEYQNGKRVGRWDLDMFGEVVGGGTYDDNGNKIGQWIDLSDDYGYKNGKKNIVMRYQLYMWKNLINVNILIISIVVEDHMMNLMKELKLGKGLRKVKTCYLIKNNLLR
ncbi:unnamed protein product [Paramecium primaurelia]|uniref:MORN repeat protein n=1 Tax=Paramecium primaurelia TaxID=5886 RepID=A0A8S1QLA8_PARPR|nr:unnamed protein product [Paramecium primaurelia]